MTLRIRTAAVLAMVALTASFAYSQAPGADTYKAKCASCHGADGLAATPVGKAMKVLSFKDPAMIKASDAQLIASTKDGKGKMPAYAGKLTDAQINDVTAYVRSLQK